MTSANHKTIASKLLAGIIAILFFLFFRQISRWTPAAGDDWIYASAAREDHPVALTIRQYHTWSGRIFSEFWGFTVAAHKGVWNLLNPLLFTGILLMLVMLAIKPAKEKKTDSFRTVLTMLAAIAMILSVPARLRMQTYTWIMGTTYVIPLVLFLFDLLLLRRYYFMDEHLPSHRWIYAAMCLCNFMVPLYMENAAALMVGADLLLLLYSLWKKDSKLRTAVIVPFVFATIGACIILMSPGSHARMAENAGFAAMSMGEKILVNWPSFLIHTFSNNAVIMRVLFACSAVVAIQQAKEQWWLALPFLACMVFNNGLLDFCGVLYGLILLVLYGTKCTKAEKDCAFSDGCIFLILCALGADLVMLLSPIFDSRSSLYSVYLWILLILVLLQKVQLSRLWTGVLLVMTCVFGVWEGASYWKLYQMVGQIDAHRKGQLTYYAANPDVSDAWILGYPADSIHSADVIEGDTVHEKAFKTYYGLNPDVTLHFYYLKDYSSESIAEN